MPPKLENHEVWREKHWCMSLSATDVMGIPEELFHWVPGEMVVIVRLPRLPVDDSQDRLVEQVRAQLNQFLKQYSITLELYGMYGRWREAPAMPPVRRRSFIFGLHKKQPLLAIFFHTRHADPTVTDALPMALSYLQAHQEHLVQVGLHIVSAMPNWLVTAAPLFYGEGGPAVLPRPAPMLDITSSPSNALLGWHIRLLDQTIPLDAKGAEDVLVAVLDTAHYPDRVLSAAARPELRRNWLLQRLASDLRNEDGSFVIEYDRYALSSDVRTGRDQYNDSRYYVMPDHGLSVAGLIRDIAPRARIRLIRVLNDYGGGDLYSLFAALTDLERELVAGSIRRLVINLSLTIMPDIRRLPYIWFDHRQWPTTQLSGAVRVLGHIEEGLRLLFESLHAHGALIVAAAGNDSTAALQQSLSPRPPRAPARYDSTLGVTSLNSTFAPSNFANAANMPPYESGLATFGGDGYGATDSNALPDAVRGIYISSTFPGGEKNASGWADWSGSSFSAAIATGLGTHLIAQGWSAYNTMIRLAGGQERQSENLFGAAPEAPSLLGNIIRVQQRFGL
jgi:Subtilase family